MADEEPPKPKPLKDIIASVAGGASRPNDSGTGRPTKFTLERREIIVQALRAGATRKTAAEFAGISERILHVWIAQGVKDAEADNDTEFYQFLHSIRAGEAEMLIRMTQTLTTAGGNDWRAALEVLKRRDRANWGDSLDLTKLSTEQLLAMYREQHGITDEEPEDEEPE